MSETTDDACRFPDDHILRIDMTQRACTLSYDGDLHERYVADETAAEPSLPPGVRREMVAGPRAGWYLDAALRCERCGRVFQTGRAPEHAPTRYLNSPLDVMLARDMADLMDDDG